MCSVYPLLSPRDYCGHVPLGVTCGRTLNLHVPSLPSMRWDKSGATYLRNLHIPPKIYFWKPKASSHDQRAHWHNEPSLSQCKLSSRRRASLEALWSIDGEPLLCGWNEGRCDGWSGQRKVQLWNSWIGVIGWVKQLLVVRKDVGRKTCADLEEGACII